MIRVLPLLAMAALAAGCKKKTPEPPAREPAPIVAPAPPPAPEERPQRADRSLNRVGFAFDSAALTPAAKSILGENVQMLSAHPDVRVEIQGHADERGSTDYNLALGERRARSVQSFLVGQGIAKSRITTVSYGEERPLAGGSDEGAWEQNRRAELRVVEGAGIVGSVR